MESIKSLRDKAEELLRKADEMERKDNEALWDEIKKSELLKRCNWQVNRENQLEPARKSKFDYNTRKLIPELENFLTQLGFQFSFSHKIDFFDGCWGQERGFSFYFNDNQFHITFSNLDSMLKFIKETGITAETSVIREEIEELEKELKQKNDLLIKIWSACLPDERSNLSKT